MMTKDKENQDDSFPAKQQRRKGFPSETKVKRGFRVVHGDKELTEKLGRNDPCLCDSRRSFQEVLHADRALRWLSSQSLLLGNRHSWRCAGVAQLAEATDSNSVR